MAPLVSVICLCYNQARFVSEALHSVLQQSYKPIELIVVDDGSTDDSAKAIAATLLAYPDVQFIRLEKNEGNCKAFNRALAQSKGEFITDFAADDVMELNRIERQVTFFHDLPTSYGVVFTDATYIDENGSVLGRHYEDLFRRKRIDRIPEGDVYEDILRSYYISSPTMLVKREVFKYLGGYDEQLAYEDFDFWVRSSRVFRYACLNEPLTKVRKVSGSMSQRIFERGDFQLYSTYVICRKAQKLNRNSDEDHALATRVRYHFRQCVLSGRKREAKLFIGLLKELRGIGYVEYLFSMLNAMPFSLAAVRRWYVRLRNG